jgi:glycosyltransferase involved in cell wall biosynthesis
MKLLSICIPTYNRNKELTILYDEFINPIVQEFGDEIEIIVCDNSDDEISSLNKSIFEETIRYYKNEENLGFAGNVLKCYEKASAEYIWIIPDNDHILTKEFIKLFSFLKTLRDKIDCLFIPYLVEDLFGEKNTRTYPNVSTIHEIYEGNIKPFVLLSDAIVKKDMTYFREIQENFSQNDFVQIALHSMSIKDSNKIVNYRNPVIDYKVEYIGRFNPIKIFHSMHEVMTYLSNYFTIDISLIEKKEYKSMLIGTFQHDTGIYQIKDMGIVRKEIIHRCSTIKDKKIHLLVLLAKLPKCIRKRIFMTKLLISSSPNVLNIKTYYKNYSLLKERIKNTSKNNH